jgi:hypothetical protein
MEQRGLGDDSQRRSRMSEALRFIRRPGPPPTPSTSRAPTGTAMVFRSTQAVSAPPAVCSLSRSGQSNPE